MKLLLRLAFDGAAYCGWQAQKNARSIQSVMTEAATRIYRVPCAVTGCSRTDSGVHARAYAATVEYAAGKCGGSECDDGNNKRDITEVMPCSSVIRAFNSILPPDIAVISAIPREDDFHARYSVISKTYEYVFYNSPVRSPFYHGRVYDIAPVDADGIAVMSAAASAMAGRRDFAAFMATGSKITDTIRTVYECGVTANGDFIVFRVRADGFLYNMVRIMAGTALAAARKCHSTDEAAEYINGIIASGERKNAGATLPPYGLYLCDVEY